MKLAVIALVVLAACGSTNVATATASPLIVTAGESIKASGRVEVSFDLFNYGAAPVNANLTVTSWAAEHSGVTSADCAIRGDHWLCGVVAPGLNGRVVRVSGLPLAASPRAYRALSGDNHGDWTEN